MNSLHFKIQIPTIAFQGCRKVTETCSHVEKIDWYIYVYRLIHEIINLLWNLWWGISTGQISDLAYKSKEEEEEAAEAEAEVRTRTAEEKEEKGGGRGAGRGERGRIEKGKKGRRRNII